ncbi:MAG TPA: hypothetical protein PKA37_04790 [Planctomycetota bacterium]|nr:hypothetical protein [Planctomycetota bacterium]
MASWLDRLKKNPTEWLLEKACPPITHRVLTEILERPPTDLHVKSAREGAFNFKNAVTISRTQQESGVWLDKVLEFEPPNPSRKRGPGMVNQFLALVEYGWDATHPIIHCSAERLLRYCREDDSTDLYELKGYAGSNKEANLLIKSALSVISAALLSRAGYGHDPAVQLVASRVLGELEVQYPEGGALPDLFEGEITIAEESKDDGVYRRLRPGRHCPDMFLYYLMAFNDLFRTPRGQAVAQRVSTFLLRGDEIRHRIREVAGKRFLKLSDLSIGSLELEYYLEGKVSYLLHDLELLARTGTLTSHEKPLRLLTWLTELASPVDGVIRLEPEIEKHLSRSQYHYFPLEDSWRGKHKRYSDVTFRVLLILKTLDRTRPLS